MTTKLNNTPVRNSAIIYKTALERIRALLEAGRSELAGEYAIATIELALTNQFSSEDFDVQMYLRDFEVMAEKNGEKYDKKKEASDAARIKKLQLKEIADYYNQGLIQVRIAEKLEISKQVVSKRLQIIKEDYPYLLDTCQKVDSNKKLTTCQKTEGDFCQKVNEVSKNEVDNEEELSKSQQVVKKNEETVVKKVAKVASNDNDNDNDNVYMDKVYSPTGRKDCPEVSLSQLAFMGVSYEELGDGYIRIKETGKLAKIL